MEIHWTAFCGIFLMLPLQKLVYSTYSSKAIIKGGSCKFTWTDARQHAHEYGPSVYYRLPFLSRMALIVPRHDKRVATWLIAVEIIPPIVHVIDIENNLFHKRLQSMEYLKLIIQMQYHTFSFVFTMRLIAIKHLFCRLHLMICKEL